MIWICKLVILLIFHSFGLKCAAQCYLNDTSAYTEWWWNAFRLNSLLACFRFCFVFDQVFIATSTIWYSKISMRVCVCVVSYIHSQHNGIHSRRLWIWISFMLYVLFLWCFFCEECSCVCILRRMYLCILLSVACAVVKPNFRCLSTFYKHHLSKQ